jgi:type III pantothenate kinase
MYLVIDIGNTLVKTALFNKAELHALWTSAHFDPLPLKEYLDSGSIRAGIVSCVREWPEEMDQLMQAGFPFFHASPDMAVPLTIAYESPATLGMDRLAAAVESKSRFPEKPVLCIMAGSCLTFDFVDHKGVYQGGSIAPGLQMRLKAMRAFTGKLPASEVPKETPPLIAKTTEASMQSGAMNGMAAEIDGMISAYYNKTENLNVILSGGDAFFFDKMLKNRIFAVENIVLHGLHTILEYNVQTDRKPVDQGFST